jgi:type IV secretion system protein VirB6
MNFIIKNLRLFFILVLFGAHPASAAWYGDTFSDATSTNKYSCYRPPTFDHNQSESMFINYNRNEWVNAGLNVEEDKLLKISWDTINDNNQSDLRRYRVLFKIDPRFQRPQVMIASFDKELNKFVWDYSVYRDGYFSSADAIAALNNFVCNDGNTDDCLKRNTYFDNVKDYINFVGRSAIALNEGDVVNILLLNPDKFFSEGLTPINSAIDRISRTNYPNELPRFTLYSDVGDFDNGIIYYNRTIAYSPTNDANYSARLNTLMGIIKSSLFESNLTLCPADTNGLSNTACLHDRGAGMVITAGESVIKDGRSFFVSHNDKLMYYYKARQSTSLNFAAAFPIDQYYSYSGMDVLTKCIVNWEENNIDDCNFTINHLYGGRYLMEIEVGPGTSRTTTTHNPHIQLEYYIAAEDEAAPSHSTSGTTLTTKFYRTDATKSGRLWIRIRNTMPEINMPGNVIAHYSAYNGRNRVSKYMSDTIVEPVTTKFKELSKQIYIGISRDTGFTRVAQILLTLYVVLYGLYFLAGGVQISLNDLVSRVVKIALVVGVMSEESWNFFNDNLFNVFLKGSDYLIVNVVGASSSSTNIFGFLDPIFERYGQEEYWGMILIYLVHLHNGLFIIAIFLIIGTLDFLKSALEVVVNYIIAILTICVLISIAPIFIVLMLFAQTRHLFDNWLSLLFNFALQPTILLLMILLMDQVIANQLRQVVVPLCWQILIPFEFQLDLSFLGLGKQDFELEFLPGIPFFTSVRGVFQDMGQSYYRVINSTLVFFVFAKMAKGMSGYVTELVNTLTNTAPARQEGVLDQRRSGSSLAHNITQDATSLTGAARTASGVISRAINLAGGLISKLSSGKNNNSSGNNSSGNNSSGNNSSSTNSGGNYSSSTNSGGNYSSATNSGGNNSGGNNSGGNNSGGNKSGSNNNSGNNNNGGNNSSGNGGDASSTTTNMNNSQGSSEAPGSGTDSTNINSENSDSSNSSGEKAPNNLVITKTKKYSKTYLGKTPQNQEGKVIAEIPIEPGSKITVEKVTKRKPLGGSKDSN